MDVNLLVTIGVGIITTLLGFLVRKMDASMVRMQVKLDTMSEHFAALSGYYVPREETDARFKDVREDYHRLRNQVGDLRTDHKVLETRVASMDRREG
jgi:hypothetical protein